MFELTSDTAIDVSKIVAVNTFCHLTSKSYGNKIIISCQVRTIDGSITTANDIKDVFCFLSNRGLQRQWKNLQKSVGEILRENEASNITESEQEWLARDLEM